jgi:tetratricopeptide (TPR) repeat protein
VRKHGNAWDPILPDGLGLKQATSVAVAWSSAAVVVQTDKKAKNLTGIPVTDLFAILPGTDRDQAVVDFLLDASDFRDVGEKDEAEAFEERMSLLAGVARNVTGEPATKLRLWLLSEMQSVDQKLSAGSAHIADLNRGLQYAAVSDQAYPNDEPQKTVRESLRAKKAWVDQRAAILKALAAGGLWDPLIEKYGDFERWDSSFEDLHHLWQTAYERSAEEHLSAANRQLANLPCQAKQELDTVLKLNPGNREARVLLDDAISECENLGGRSCGKAEDPKSAEYRTVTRFLADADSYANTGRFDEAEAALKSAESRAKDSPRVLFARAALFETQRKPLKALDVLNQYMSCVSGTDAEKGEASVSRIKVNLENDKKNLKQEVVQSETAGNYVDAMKKLDQALALDEGDPDVLVHAGIESAINRRYSDAVRLLNQYLRLPASSTGSKRSEVINMLPRVKPAAAEPDGAPNWFSGYKSPPGIFYCPVSLAPNPHIADVHGSRKLTATWQWADNRLSSVKTVIQQPNETGFTAYFDYFKDGRAVRRIDKTQFDPKEDPPIPSFTPTGAVSKAQGTFVVLANYPAIDPLMVSRLTGKNIAVLVTGNPYFNPFAWDGIFAFVAQYDDQNRVVSAAEIEPEGHAPRTLDFKWDGLRLVEVAERGGEYKRTMTYLGGRLVEEIVSYRGKNIKIAYKYSGDRLVSARCDDDPSLGNRSREVKFADR